MTDWGAVYRANVAAVADLVGGLDESGLRVYVDATPAWTVHDVLAHLAGGAADAVSGRMDGAPGPAWTARHVSERAHLLVSVLVDELRANQDAVAASVADNPRPALVWNIAVHLADLHEALDRGRPDPALWQPVADAVSASAPDSVTTAVPDYEIFRAAFSRRSRLQMVAWGTLASSDELDAMCLFGPREDDQPVPAA